MRLGRTTRRMKKKLNKDKYSHKSITSSKNPDNIERFLRNGKPVESKYDRFIKSVYRSQSAGHINLFDLETYPSNNTLKKQAREHQRKKRGVVGVTEPEEVKKAIAYLQQSPTAAKVINYLENLKVITRVQTGERFRFDMSETQQYYGQNLIDWYSHSGLAVTNTQGQVIGYLSAAILLFHEMLHAAIEHGYLEANNLVLEDRVDESRHHNPEHKFIVEMEWQVIDELKKVDKNNQETKRAYYKATAGQRLMKDGPTSSNTPLKHILELHSKDEHRRLFKLFNQRKKSYNQLYNSSKD